MPLNSGSRVAHHRPTREAQHGNPSFGVSKLAGLENRGSRLEYLGKYLSGSTFQAHVSCRFNRVASEATSRYRFNQVENDCSYVQTPGHFLLLLLRLPCQYPFSLLSSFLFVTFGKANSGPSYQCDFGGQLSV
jgi:hypothetical protein